MPIRLPGKTVGVLVERQYQEREVWYPPLRVIEEGADGVLIGPAAGEAHPSKLDYPAVAGKLITSRKPTDLPAFCREIIEALRGE